MILDGRALAKAILAQVKARAAVLPSAPRIVAIVTSETPATKSYLSIKEKRAADAGCALDTVRLSEDASTESLIAAVLAAHADAIIVQLPLPESVVEADVCNAIPPSKDADVLSATARAAFENTDGALLPPVVGAVRKILEFGNVNIAGKRAVVIGAGFLVGAPVAKWLARQGAAVEVVTKESGDLSATLRAADIVVSGAGAPHLITPDLLKEGVVLIDAGTSESGGAIVGDADPACAEKCALFTPVPGGVGPVAVAKLFENVVVLAEESCKKAAD